MEIKLDKTTQVIAYRVMLENKQKKYYRNFAIVCLVLATLLSLVALAFTLNAIFIDSSINYIISALINWVYVALLIWLTVFLFKKDNRLIKISTYPPEAIILDKDKLLIVREEVQEIKLSDIERVYSREFMTTNYLYSTVFDYGDLKIILKDKKGKIKLSNIAKVEEVCMFIRSLLNK